MTTTAAAKLVCRLGDMKDISSSIPELRGQLNSENNRQQGQPTYDESLLVQREQISRHHDCKIPFSAVSVKEALLQREPRLSNWKLS